MKHSYLLLAKVATAFNNWGYFIKVSEHFINGCLIEDMAYFNGNLESKKLYTPIEHPITLQKMILTVFRSFFF